MRNSIQGYSLQVYYIKKVFYKNISQILKLCFVHVQFDTLKHGVEEVSRHLSVSKIKEVVNYFVRSLLFFYFHTHLLERYGRYILLQL